MCVAALNGRIGLLIQSEDMPEKMIALRSEIPESVHIKFKSYRALDQTNIKEKIAELVEEYVKTKEKKQ